MKEMSGEDVLLNLITIADFNNNLFVVAKLRLSFTVLRIPMYNARMSFAIIANNIFMN